MASTLRIERLTNEQGLSENYVYFSVQDNDGFMWFGTADGLNRYDGYQFKHFRHDPQRTDSISGNYLTTGLAAKDGSLWVGTLVNGLNRYDRRYQRFTRFGHDRNDPNSLADNHVAALAQDNQGRLWVGTSQGLDRYDPQNHRFVHLKARPDDPDGLSDNSIQVMLTDRSGIIWIGTKKGLNRFDPKTGLFKRFVHVPGDRSSLGSDDVLSLCQSADGSLWVGTNGGGLNRFDSHSGRFIRYVNRQNSSDSLIDNVVSGIAEDLSGGLWVGTEKGLSRLGIKRRHFQHYRHQVSDPFSLSHGMVVSVIADSNGLIWAGTAGGGVNKIDISQLQFGHYQHDTSVPRSLSRSFVMSIFKDAAGTLWVGTEGGGLNRQRPGMTGFDHFRHQNGVPSSIHDDKVRAIFEDSSGRLWIGTYNGLDVIESGYDADGPLTFRHFVHQPAQPDSLSDNLISVVYEDRQGNVWIGTWGGGLNRYLPETGTFEHYKHDPFQPDSLSHDIVTTLYEDRQQRFWVGTLQGGISRFDRQTGTFFHYPHDKHSVKSLSNGTVANITQDSHGRLWIGTSGGLNKFDPDTGLFKYYQKQQGLANDMVYSAIEDKQGMLWLSTNQGISRFDPESETIHNFDVKDGIQGKEFNSGAWFAANDGELFFGGIGGFNRFYPQRIKQDTQGPKVVFTDFFLVNKSVGIDTRTPVGGNSMSLPMAVDQLSEVTFSHSLPLISFEFAALNYRNVMNNRYEYKLEGFDEYWISTDPGIRRASYTSLPPGHYRLRIRAANSAGYQGKELTMAITVPPPWFQTWQARLSFILAIVAVIYGFYRYRTEALMNRARELEHRVAQRTATINRLMLQKERMFTNASHEFKTPLTLIQAPLDSLVPGMDEVRFNHTKSMIKRNSQRLLRMVDQLLELARLDTTEVEQKYHYSLSETLKQMLALFAPLFQSKHIRLHSPNFEDVILYMTVDSVEMILNNLISNALKYTPTGGEISVAVTRDGDKVAIAVRDTGVGISEENQKIVFDRFTRACETHDESIPGAGIGLALVKELVEANDGSLTLDSEVGCGSTFTVTLPVCADQQAMPERSSGLSTASLIEMSVPPMAADVGDEPGDEVQDDGTRPTILLIDDNADMLTLLKDILSDDYRCLKATSGELGLQLAAEYLPELVISDVMMPGISGFEVLKQLKQDALTDHIPVVLLTAKGDTQSRIKGWTQMADEYLEKPFHGEELKTRIANLLSIRDLLRRRFQRAFAESPGNISVTVASAEPLPEHKNINQINEQFLYRINDALERHYHNETLDVSTLANELGISYRQLCRKMKTMFDLTPNEAIRSYRLKKAAQKLREGFAPSTVYHEVGFTSHSYFSQCFKAQFNCLPSEYAATL